MKNLYVLVISAGLVVVMFTGHSVSAEEYGQKGEQGHYRGMEGKAEKAMEELGLTEEQKAMLKEVRTKNREQKKNIREVTKEQREVIKIELDKPVSDESKINSAINQITELQEKILRNRVDGVLSMKKILTSEQFQMMREKFQGRKDKIKSKKGHGKEARGKRLRAKG